MASTIPPPKSGRSSASQHSPSVCCEMTSSERAAYTRWRLRISPVSARSSILLLSNATLRFMIGSTSRIRCLEKNPWRALLRILCRSWSIVPNSPSWGKVSISRQTHGRVVFGSLPGVSCWGHRLSLRPCIGRTHLAILPTCSGKESIHLSKRRVATFRGACYRTYTSPNNSLDL
jgi:hypothetical protein